MVGRSLDPDDAPKAEFRNYAQERLKELMEKGAGSDGQAAVHKLDGNSDTVPVRRASRAALAGFRAALALDRLIPIGATLAVKIQAEDHSGRLNKHKAPSGVPCGGRTGFLVDTKH